MAGHEHLLKAIVVAARADATLVTLTGHSSVTHRIGRKAPPVKGRLPFLGISVPISVPLLGEYVSRLQMARVEFDCVADKQDELGAIRIADRLEVLLNPDEDTAPNTGYWDMSDTSIQTKSVRFKSRLGPVFDEKLDVYTVKVVADAIWINEPCLY